MGLARSKFSTKSIACLDASLVILMWLISNRMLSSCLSSDHPSCFFISMHDSKLISCVFMRRLSVFPTFQTYIKLGLPNCLLCILATFIASDHLICFLSFLLIYLWEEQTLAWLLAPSFFLINDGNHFNLNNNFLLFFLFLLLVKNKKKKINISGALFSSFVILLCSFCTL
jgi:hypothetical protein